MDFTTTFVLIDDFCQHFEPKLQQRLLAGKQRQRRRATRLALSEIMTILICFHTSQALFEELYAQGTQADYDGAGQDEEQAAGVA